MKKLTKKIRDKIQKAYPTEFVYAIKDGKEVELTNISTEPNHFEVDAIEVYKLNPDAMVHSHPDHINHPSLLDAMTQRGMGIPFGIVTVTEDGVSDVLWFPDLKADMTTKEYILNVYDEWELVRSYHPSLLSWPKEKITKEHFINMLLVEEFTKKDINLLNNGDVCILSDDRIGVYADGVIKMVGEIEEELGRIASVYTKA